MKLIVNLLFSILLCSCMNQRENQELNLIHINVDDSPKEVMLSDIIDSIKIIPLETSEKILLGDISSIGQDEGKYFIQNGYDRLIYIFNTNGQFERQLVYKGNGPGEIQFPEDYTLDKINKEVWLSNNNNFMRYDYNGSYLGKREYSLSFSDFCIDNKGIIYYYTAKTDNAHIQDGFLTGDLTAQNQNGEKETWFKSKLVGYYKPGDAITTYSSTHPFCVQEDGSITFYYTFTDTIYSIKNNKKIEPKYCIHLGKNSIPTNLLNNMPGIDIKKYVQSNADLRWLVNNVFENNAYLYFTYLTGFEKSYTVIYNKKNRKTTNMYLTDDLFGSQWLKIKDCNNNYFIGYLTAYDMKINDKLSSYVNEETLLMLKNLSPEDNPVIVEFTIKENI